MLRSMTGYGAAEGNVEGVEYAVEVRSVNSRYLKAIINLPESWGRAEAEIEKAIRRRIQRGTVTLTVRMRLRDQRAACLVNVAALTAYLDQLRLVEVEGNPMLRVDLGSLLLLPGVCEPPSMEDLCRRTWEGLAALVEQALDALQEMRAREGQALQSDLMGHCRAIDRSLEQIAAAAPQVILDYQQRLRQRVAELTQAGNLQLDQDQLAREVAIFAERCDIAEELARLRGHLDHFRQDLAGEGSGRKLDFIAQEMLREANTIASKANDALIARAIVEVKTAVDRIKEQVQNVE